MKITQAQLALVLAPWYGKTVTVPQFVTGVIESLGIDIEPYALIPNPSTDKDLEAKLLDSI